MSIEPYLTANQCTDSRSNRRANDSTDLNIQSFARSQRFHSLSVDYSDHRSHGGTDRRSHSIAHDLTN